MIIYEQRAALIAVATLLFVACLQVSEDKNYIGTASVLTRRRVLNVDFATNAEFMNWHSSLDVGGPVERVFQPRNNVVLDSPLDVQRDDFRGGLAELKEIVALAKANGKRVRAFGSRWSASNIAYTNEYAVDTRGLTYVQVGFDEPLYVAEAYQPMREQLVFSQTGVMIKYLSRELKAAGLTLPATGGSDGQRLGGVISTGTHGSSLLHGSVTEFVRGMHLVVSETRHVFLQRASDPVVTAEFVTSELEGAELIENDALFNAALVNLGSFGLIHAYVLKVEPWFPLRTQLKIMKYEDIKDIVSDMKVSSLGFDREVANPAVLPHFLSYSVNPFRLGRTYVTLYDRTDTGKDFDTSSEPPASNVMYSFIRFFSPLLGVLVQILESLGFVGRFILKGFYGQFLEIELADYNDRHLSHSGGGISDIFTSPGVEHDKDPFPLPTTTMEVGVPVEKVTEVVELWRDIASKRFLAQPIYVRYEKRSVATLAFTRFEDYTAMIGMTGGWTKNWFRNTGDAYEEIFAAMAERKDSIPHCWHWGKKHPTNNNEWVIACLGSARDQWMEQRAVLLDSDQREMFSNENLVLLGLHEF